METTDKITILECIYISLCLLQPYAIIFFIIFAKEKTFNLIDRLLPNNPTPNETK